MGIADLILQSLNQKDQTQRDLARNQNALDQQRNNDLGLQNRADAHLTDVNAGLRPKESASDIGLQTAQGLYARANARNTDEQTKYVGDIARANIYNTRQQGGLYGAQTGLTGAQTTGENQLNKLTGNAFTFRTLDDSISEHVRQMLRLGLGPLGN